MGRELLEPAVGRTGRINVSRRKICDLLGTVANLWPELPEEIERQTAHLRISIADKKAAGWVESLDLHDDAAFYP